MKISKSKQELARIISENGGWRDGAEWAAQDGDKTGSIDFFKSKPYYDKHSSYWRGKYDLSNRIEESEVTIKNFHQSILSRDEYFHLYPAPDADGWIACATGECPVSGDPVVDVKFRDGETAFGRSNEWIWSIDDGNGDIIAYRLHKLEQEKSTAVGDGETNSATKEEFEVMEYQPSIEQLAGDYRNKLAIATQAQEEADSHRCGAEVALSKLEIAAKELGFKIEPITAKQESELVITDWRDLRVGDVVEIIDSSNNFWKEHFGLEMTVKKVYPDQGDNDDQVDLIGESGGWSLGGNTTWRFIRRP